MNRFSIAVFLLIAAAATGCRKPHSSPAPSASAAETPAPAAPAAPALPSGPGLLPPPPVAVIAPQSSAQAALGQLSLELRKYVARTRRAPKSFEEFIANSHLQAPPAPAGKKYAIQNGAVVLVNL